jgi:hypothetical protein
MSKKELLLGFLRYMKDTLFTEHDDTILEEFENIFDSSTNEKRAKKEAIEYYLDLREDGLDLDKQDVIDIAESYGIDFSDFDEILKKYE